MVERSIPRSIYHSELPKLQNPSKTSKLSDQSLWHKLDITEYDLLLLDAQTLQKISFDMAIWYVWNEVFLLDTQNKKILINPWNFELIEYLWWFFFKVWKWNLLGIYDIRKQELLLNMINLDNISYDEDDKIFYLDFFNRTFELSLDDLMSWKFSYKDITSKFKLE